MQNNVSIVTLTFFWADLFTLHDGLPDVGLDVLDAAQKRERLDVQMFGSGKTKSIKG